MAGQVVVFRANRKTLALWAIGFLVLGAACFWVAPSLVNGNSLAGQSMVLLPLPGAVRVGLFQVFGVLCLLLPLILLPVFVDPRIVEIDDEGILVRSLVRKRFGYWQDFERLDVRRQRRARVATLRFGRTSNAVPRAETARRLSLSLRIYGVSLDAVMKEMRARLAKLGQQDAAAGDKEALRRGTARSRR